VNTELDHVDIAQVVKQAISQETKISLDQLREDEPLESYGIESVMAVSIVRRLEETFGELAKTLLFEYQTLGSLLRYFEEEFGGGGDAVAPAPHAARVGTHAGEGRSALDPGDKAAPLPPTSERGFNDVHTADGSAVTSNAAGPSGGVIGQPAGASTAFRGRQAAASDARAGALESRVAGRDEIAIIGISGRFPQAKNLEEFWDNLSRGRDCITEIPAKLWDWRDYWDPERGIPGKSYSKWGGFIEDADCFDPLFFNISNLAAEAMDPQERVFLETVHHTLEDAGYTRQGLRGQRVGLYVSVMWGPYQHYGAHDASTDSSFSSIANRASYFFDFRGPSIALDTTCSGSLTTVHLACESLRAGETDLAFAGGVNITSHQHKYLVLSRTGFASTDGRCRSFAAGGDGYVPGDGVGAVLLKPLAAAVADGDRVYAVIKSSSINHGGKSSGFTVPSAEAQANLIVSALQKGSVDPRSISYVEAHAPGTVLGDPIEVRGLTDAFRNYTQDRGFCAIGSVKSNIGHLESAAGFASVAKVVLQLQHRQLVPSIHSEALNPNIKFDATPFYVQRELTPWQAPTIKVQGRNVSYPLRAGVSSFGAGGSNAHVIIEEYAAPVMHRQPAIEQLIVLSAKTEDRLRAVAENLLDFIERRRNSTAAPFPVPARTAEQLLERISEITRVRAALLDDSDRLDDLLADPDVRLDFLAQIRDEFGVALDAGSLNGATIGNIIAAVSRDASGDARDSADGSRVLLEQIAYTLQVGREAMPYRFATLVQSLSELEQRLRDYLAGEVASDQTWTGKVLHAGMSPEEEDYIARLVASHRYERLGRLWCNGGTIPWGALHSEPKPRRIALPLYPFERERCWVGQPAAAHTAGATPPAPRVVDAAVNPPDHAARPGVPVDGGDLRRLVFRPKWSQIVPTTQTAEAEVTAPTKGQLLIYPHSASFMVDALKRLLPPGDTYEVLLGSRTELLTQRSWEVDVFEEGALAACLMNIDALDTVYFLGGYHGVDWDAGTKAAFDRLEAQSVLSLFRLVKALAARQSNGRAPQLKVLTNHTSPVLDDECLQPYTSAALGFARAVGREYPQFATEIIDVDLSAEDVASPWGQYATLRHLVQGVGGHREFAVRAGQPYVRQLHPYELEAAGSLFKRDGLYVLIGGAGAVGTNLSHFLAGLAGARLVWLGRRREDDSITSQIAEVERAGGKLSYIKADAADAEQLARAFDTIEREHGSIDGVMHLAMVHEVTRIQELSEGHVRRTLAAKTASTYALYTALQRRSVGFVALFSSAEANVGNIGWGGYAAACSFQDAFALYWAQRATWPVISVNWGYWEGTDPEVAKMLAAKGVYQLSAAQGAAILERALTNRVTQLTALNVGDEVLERMGIVPPAITLPVEAAPATRPAQAEPAEAAPVVAYSAPPAAAPVVTPNGGAPAAAAATGAVSVATAGAPAPATDGGVPPHGAVTTALIDLLSSVLKIDKSRFEVDADLITYGIDSLNVVALHKTLEAKVGSLPATLFITFNTINAVATHLLEQYPDAARALTGHAVEAPAVTAQPAPAWDGAGAATESDGVMLLGLVAPSETVSYLEGYGKLFRENRLEQAAKRVTTRAISAKGQELTHLLVNTPVCERVELFSVGDDVPVLLLPAVGLTAPTWRYQLASTLTRTMRLSVTHPPGYGITKPIPDCTTKGMASTFKSVMDLIAPERPIHLVASCLGCVSAIYLARFFPERVASMTLVGAFHNAAEMLVGDPAKLSADELEHILVSAVDKIKDDFAGVTKRHAHNGNGTRADADTSASKEALSELLLNSLCANALIAMRYLSEMLTISPLGWLPEIKVPTQCIYGTNDKIVSTHHSKTISEAIPGAKLVEIEGAGHFPYLTHSEEFNPLLERFVRQHESTLRGV
jgi:acyl transferase domain-containing protein/pimeloyl-ACP methyl ester carboxylesterase